MKFLTLFVCRKFFRLVVALASQLIFPFTLLPHVLTLSKPATRTG